MTSIKLNSSMFHLNYMPARKQGSFYLVRQDTYSFKDLIRVK